MFLIAILSCPRMVTLSFLVLHKNLLQPKSWPAPDGCHRMGELTPVPAFTPAREFRPSRCADANSASSFCCYCFRSRRGGISSRESHSCNLNPNLAFVKGFVEDH